MNVPLMKVSASAGGIWWFRTSVSCSGSVCITSVLLWSSAFRLVLLGCVLAAPSAPLLTCPSDWFVFSTIIDFFFCHLTLTTNDSLVTRFGSNEDKAQLSPPLFSVLFCVKTPGRTHYVPCEPWSHQEDHLWTRDAGNYKIKHRDI